MEELKLLVESIAGLPDLAIWVVAMYFFFKLAIVGSIFGIVRFIAFKIHHYFNNKTEYLKQESKDKHMQEIDRIDLEKSILDVNASKPIEHHYKIGDLSIHSTSNMSGKLIELFSVIKNDHKSWAQVFESDISKTIEIIKEHRNQKEKEKEND